MNLAFYGTLRDPDLVNLVAGEDMTLYHGGTVEARGWTCQSVDGEDFPMLSRKPRARAQFTLYRNCPFHVWHRLLAYEGSDYTWHFWSYRSINYRMFLPTMALKSSGQQWTLVAFQNDNKRRYLAELACNYAAIPSPCVPTVSGAPL